MVKSIHADGVPPHKNPIPAAAVHRGLIASSVIMGQLPDGRFEPDKNAQIALAFQHFKTVLAASGGDLQDVVKLDLCFADKADRPIANPHWLRFYPDDTARPARHASVGEMPQGCYLQITFLAVLV